MKHQHEVKVDFVNASTDLDELIEQVGSWTILVIGFYMAADTTRHILKTLIR